MYRLASWPLTWIRLVTCERSAVCAKQRYKARGKGCVSVYIRRSLGSAVDEIRREPYHVLDQLLENVGGMPSEVATGSGLFSLKQRIAAIGGTLTIDSS